MDDIRFTLSSDGPSDAVLLHHLQWLLRQHLHEKTTIQSQWADLRSVGDKPKRLSEKISVALKLYPCDLLFVHRDAEKQEPSDRFKEISKAMAEIEVAIPYICVVPIRMTEAWLLFDEKAIRRASGNPNGKAPIEIPCADVERLADPKDFLNKVLRGASSLHGRKLRSFDPRNSMHRIADYIDDFSPLRSVSAFNTLERDLVKVLNSNKWELKR